MGLTHGNIIRLFFVSLTITLLFAPGYVFGQIDEDADNLRKVSVNLFPLANNKSPSTIRDESSDMISRDDANDSVYTSLLSYPNEVYFGDVVYIAILYHNTSMTRTFHESVVSYDEWNSMYENVVITLRYKNDRIQYNLSRLQLNYPSMIGGSSRHFYPNTISVGKVFRIATPPIREWDRTFWKNISHEIKEKGSAEITISLERLNHGMNEFSFSHSQIVKIKKRPDSEMALLGSWFDESRKNKIEPLPIEFGNGSSQMNPPSSIRDVRIDVRPEFSIGNFLRRERKKHNKTSIHFRNFLPYMEDAPSTLNGWRELERSFADGSIKNEIHLTSLIIDYKLSQLSKSHDLSVKETAIFQWLSNRPLAERLALTYWLGVNFKDLLPKIRSIEVDQSEIQLAP